MLLALIAYAVASGVILLWIPMDGERVSSISRSDACCTAEFYGQHMMACEWEFFTLRKFLTQGERLAAVASRGANQRVGHG